MDKNMEELLKNTEIYMGIIRKKIEEFDRRITELEKKPTLEEVAKDFKRRGFIKETNNV